MQKQTEPPRTNSPPSFSSEFPSEVTIHKTETPQAWSLKLSQTVDLDDGDVVKVTARLGPAALFMQFDAVRNILSIPSLSSPAVLEGTYEGLKLILQDSAVV